MLEKIQTIKTRINELETMLADPDLVSDFSKSQGLLREHAMIKPLAELSEEFSIVVEQIDQLKTIIRNDSDKEVVELANLELPDLQEKKLNLEQELRIALLPKDPNDFKNVIMEIRAGTGGEEASLFAADLQPHCFYQVAIRCVVIANGVLQHIATWKNFHQGCPRFTKGCFTKYSGSTGCLKSEQVVSS